MFYMGIDLVVYIFFKTGQSNRKGGGGGGGGKLEVRLPKPYIFSLFFF